MKKIKQISVLLFLLISTATGYAQNNQDAEEEVTTKIEYIYKNVNCSNHKKWLEKQGFKYDRMLKIEQTNAYVYSIEDEGISVFLYCHNNEAVHMSFNVPEDVFSEAKDATSKNREFKKIKQTSEDVIFTKGSYAYIFSNKNHSIGIRVKTGDDY
ncbi:hypothetical protein IDJ75_01930 [Mucilaginibacter rigui]|uniref:Uncharacterized protein n=1 Tax=Mucilaginibacter rigui TaxID=534635 RepID=A0ABR7X219_9SPHI|nr:hypothetical protein [Mucilaginibacter rigui]MBD1384020.1 hypothetical protein [Mucilaginibacter rigui]